MLILNKQQKIAYIVMAIIAGSIFGVLLTVCPDYFCYRAELGAFAKLNGENRVYRKLTVFLIVLPIFYIINYFWPMLLMNYEYDSNASYKKFFLSTLLPLFIAIGLGILSIKLSGYLTLFLMNVI